MSKQSGKGPVGHGNPKSDEPNPVRVVIGSAEGVGVYGIGNAEGFGVEYSREAALGIRDRVNAHMLNRLAEPGVLSLWKQARRWRRTDRVDWPARVVFVAMTTAFCVIAGAALTFCVLMLLHALGVR